MKIIGNTVGTTIPKPNLMQTDPTKGDYVKGKNEFLESFKPNIEVDDTLTQSGKAADAKAVGDAINAIPVSTADDGYTEITGLRQAISTNIVKSGNAITVTTALEGDETTISEITLNSEGYPTTIVTDGVECAISWEGFDASTATIDTTLDEIIGEEI